MQTANVEAAPEFERYISVDSIPTRASKYNLFMIN